MCNTWQNPKQGVFLSITCKCNKYSIAKRHCGQYELLRNGVTCRGLGMFDSAAEAKAAIDE